MTTSAAPDRINLSQQRWTLFGLSPEQWRVSGPTPHHPVHSRQAGPIEAAAPGSVQAALFQAGLIPDWNVGLNARLAEWVENRQWFFETEIALPREPEYGERVVLTCAGLDYKGWIFVNGALAGSFDNAFVPHDFDLTGLLRAGEGNTLTIGFDLPPRWQGHYGYTDRMTEWKPRFHFTWDWTPRMVQIGVWDEVWIEYRRSPRVDWLDVTTGWDVPSASGWTQIAARFDGCPTGLSAHIEVAGSDELPLGAWRGPASRLAAGVSIEGLEAQPWWPNGMGGQSLYNLKVQILDGEGALLFNETRRIGFRDIHWKPCEDASAGAGPWICVVNGRSVFLQGVNWTPLRPLFADVGDEELRARVALYRDMGANTLRAWGGAAMERAAFFDACDEMGLLVWQEFPLSSSGVENTPPSDAPSICSLTRIARSYVERRKHHPCVLLWCGGNELMDKDAQGHDIPCQKDHPMLAALAAVAQSLDPARRFVHASPSGPAFIPSPDNVGKGLHWDTHGPWRCEEPGEAPPGWLALWREDDSLFRSECGAPGASPARLIERFRGDLPAMPPHGGNPLWARTSWWIEWDTYIQEKGQEPASLEEYVAWSQARQAALLGAAARLTKSRFPKCGGFLLWMGHDCFPCAANTAVIDFEGRPKPAYEAVREVFQTPPEAL